MNWISPQGIIYLASAQIECPVGEILHSIEFEHTFKNFRYAYRCLRANQELEYKTIVNDWTDYLGWATHLVGKLGDVNFLDRQLLQCPEGGLMASIRMEVDFEAEKLRYIYKCGKLKSGSAPTCHDRQTPEIDPVNYHLPTLEQLGMKCESNEGLFKFQLRARYDTPRIWYNFTCCSLPETGT